MPGCLSFSEMPAGVSGRCAILRLLTLSMYILFISVFIAVESVDAGSVADETACAFVFADTVAARDRVPIADPLAGGPLDILFVGRYDRVGGVVTALSPRLECRFASVFTETERKLGNASFSSRFVSEEAVTALLDSLLDSRWNVIWLDFTVQSLPAEVRKKLFAAVSSGTGLVYLGDKDDLSSFKTKGSVDRTQIEAFKLPGIDVKFAGMRDNGIMTAMSPPLRAVDPGGDYAVSAINTLMFTSGRRTGTVVRGIDRPKRLKFEGMHFHSYRIDLLHDTEPEKMTVYCTYRNTDDEVIDATSDVFNINKDKTFVMLDYPLLPAGTYTVDIFIEGADGVNAVTADRFEVLTDQMITGIDFFSPYVREGGVISGFVLFSHEIEESIAMAGEIIDENGRVISAGNLEVTTKKLKVPFSFLVKDSPGRFITVRIYSYRSYELFQEFEKTFAVVKAYDPDAFSFILEPGEGEDDLTDEDIRTLCDSGVSAFASHIGNDKDVDLLTGRVLDASRGNATFIPILTPPGIDEVMEKEHNPDDKPDRISSVVSVLRNFMPPVYVGWPGNTVSDDGTRFRSFLVERYGTVDSVNKAWGSALTTLRDAEPLTLDEACESGRFMPWIDSVLFGEDEMFAIQRSFFTSVARMDSTAGVSLYGFPEKIRNHASFNPYRWKDSVTSVTMDEFDSYGRDAAVLPPSLALSYSDPEALHCLMIGGNAIDRDNGADLRSVPWRSLFSGMNGVWWKPGTERFHAPLTPNRLLSPAFSTIAREVASIRSGIDRLLLGSVKRTDPVGILYSPASVLSSEMTDVCMGTLPRATKTESPNSTIISLRGCYYACLDAGYSPVLLVSEQLDAISEGHDLSVLILPYAQVLSDDTLMNVRTFVERGGTVIADMRTAVMDGSLNRKRQGALDDIFGIAQAGDGSLPLAKGSLAPNGSGGLANVIEGGVGCFADPGVSVRGDGEQKASVGDRPAVIVNRYGSGRTLFLNMWMGDYENIRCTREGTEIAKLFRHFLSSSLESESSGPSVSVTGDHGDPVNAVSKVIFIDGEFLYAGILGEPGTATGDGGRGLDVTVRLEGVDRPMAAYDVRSGSFLGISNNLELSIAPGTAHVIAYLPYRVRSVDVSMKDTVLRVGEKAMFTASLVTDVDYPSYGRHVYRVDVYDPDGIRKWYQSGVYEAPGGSLSGDLFISPNEAHGRWLIRVTDAATGRSGERTFMVMPSSGN